ncbi:hypothetical protein [Stackebrandtia nassauensis]|uniref:Uncharacterized protein n=1 Tax=Stackebrandtia nassauensis (strain DSM 44728 / CIP 108903 / NRRL B-16338 / NBRC 102104 / LLR-40K-21) TaxID=446470 RepID=D3Q0H8_STANL|nr:hypothetical protein [Stackebrandtia nassauensis]ADD41714.1 hypothetical protein Snas_2019 [Stackebrandtia nassauensis DSM 44728]
MNKQEFIGKLDTAIDGLADAIAKKGVRFPEEFNDIPGASKLGVPEPKHGASHYPKVKPYEPAMRGFIKDESVRLFAPWKNMPDPAGFDAAIQHVVNGRGKIATKDVTSVSDIKQMDLGTQMPGYMVAVRENLADWRGKTIEAAHLNYINLFDEMLFLQANTLRVLELTLKAHQKGISDAQDDTVKLVDSAAAAVDAIDCWGGDSNKNVAFNVVAGVIGVLGAATPGVNAVVALAGAAGGLGIAKDLISSKDPESVPLGASRIDGVWSNLTSALDRHKELYKEGESLLATTITNFNTVLNGNFTTGQGPDGKTVTKPGVELIRLSTPIDLGSVQAPLA